MGCTSAKPQRTTSIEDVTSKPHQQNQVPDKNGQVNKAPEKAPEKILREKTNETNAIEIPGAHKSFMAPDGIPFIDEDVESELDDGTIQPAPPSAANDIQNVKHSSPDQNKNVAIVVNKEVKVANADAVTATKSSALRENAPQPPSHEESRKEIAVTSEPVVISDIKIKEIQITTTKSQETDSSEARNRSTLTDEKSKTDEELAATKIQAGIRGFLDRQKVKAIRANIQHPTEGQEQQKDSAEQQSGPKITVTEHVVEETELNFDGPHDPKLDEAATKIQANYKGYRTRKEIKITHSK